MKQEVKKQIHEIWDSYILKQGIVKDTKGKVIGNIDEKRLKSIVEIKEFINQFLNDDLTVYEFKSVLDSYNKRNNLWGFTATKGQMFFNQLLKTNTQSIDEVSKLLKQLIVEPKSKDDALKMIERLEQYVTPFFSQAKDKRKAPNPSSIGYFLSYFWQIHNNIKWQIYYTSLINAYKSLGIWEEQPTQKANYDFFYSVNSETRDVLAAYAKRDISNWDAEHAFWNYVGKPNVQSKKLKTSEIENKEEEEKIEIKADFELKEYVIPKVSNLIELGKDIDKSPSERGSKFEKAVAEVFKQLGFEISLYGQGKGRNPDVIIKFQEERIAFIVDAKAYANGYTMGLDDRAIRDYINHHCPLLKKDGFVKIGFIIVSNHFKSDLNDFINEITWNTDIKRFKLITSEALLYYLAYKGRDGINLPTIIESIVNSGNVITAENVIEEFADI